MFVINALGDALAAAGSMGWEILWPLILGFTLSGIIQAVVRTDRITQLMHDDSPRAISVATGLGALSSSCSYAAVALARAPVPERAPACRRDGVRGRRQRTSSSSSA